MSLMIVAITIVFIENYNYLFEKSTLAFNVELR